MMNRKVVLLVLAFGFIALVSPAKSHAIDPEYVIDPECQAYLLLKDPSKLAECNVLCDITCVESGKHCTPGLPDSCDASINLETLYPEVKPTFSSAVNVFGTDLCPTSAGGGVDDPFCTMIIIRLVFYAFLSLIMFVSLVMGLWVVWERSTAADSPEKVEKAVAIGKNVIVGMAIVFFFLGMVQISALLLGLTGSLFDISIVPQPRPIPMGGKCDNIYGTCTFPQICREDDPADPNQYCLNP